MHNSKTTQKEYQKLVFKTDYRLMQVKNIAEIPREHSAILLTFIKLPFVLKTFVLSIFEWPLKTGSTAFTVLINLLPKINMSSHEDGHHGPLACPLAFMGTSTLMDTITITSVLFYPFLMIGYYVGHYVGVWQF